MLERVNYEKLRRPYDDGNLEKFEMELKSFNEELTHRYIHEYLSQNDKEMREDLKKADYFRSFLSMQVQDRCSYEIGFFHAVMDIFAKLMLQRDSCVNFEKRMDALYEKKNIDKIVAYLLHHPDAQHKVIAKDLDIKTNYLSELMRELECAGCVERYAAGKRSFYSLSLDGQTYVRKKERDKRKTADQTAFLKFSPAKYNLISEKRPQTGISKYKYAARELNPVRRKNNRLLAGKEGAFVGNRVFVTGTGSY